MRMGKRGIGPLVFVIMATFSFIFWQWLFIPDKDILLACGHAQTVIDDKKKNSGYLSVRASHG